MNRIFRDLYRTQIELAISKSEAIKNLDHNLVKGRLREIFLDDLLRPVTPPSLMLRSGVVMDYLGGQTGEIDVIVANRTNVPLLALGSRDGIFPIEAVVYVIEVKSNIDMRAAKDACLKFERLYQRQSLPSGAVSYATLKQYEKFFKRKISSELPKKSFANDYGALKPPSILFGYKAARDIDKIIEYIGLKNSTSNCPLVRAVCIPQRGYWTWNTVGKWDFVRPDNSLEEVMAMISGVANTMYLNQNNFTGVEFGHYLTNTNFQRLT